MNVTTTAQPCPSFSSEMLEAVLRHPSILQDKLNQVGLTLDTYEVLAWFMMRKNLRVSAHAFFFATNLTWAIGAASIRSCSRELKVSHECLRKEIKEWQRFLEHRTLKQFGLDGQRDGHRDGHVNAPDGASERQISIRHLSGHDGHSN